MCKICLKRTLDATFLDCFALTFCDIIGELLPEWACLTLQGGTTFLLTSKLADIPVSRVRKQCLQQINYCISLVKRVPSYILQGGFTKPYASVFYQSYHYLVSPWTSKFCICLGGSTNLVNLFSYHSCASWFHQTTDYFTWWVQQSYLFFSVLRHFYFILCLVAPPNEG